MHRRIGKIKSMHLAVTKNTGNPNKAVIQSEKNSKKIKMPKRKQLQRNATKTSNRLLSYYGQKNYNEHIQICTFYTSFVLG